MVCRALRVCGPSTREPALARWFAGGAWAAIVAAGSQPEARVVDVARRHGMVAHRLSEWRRFVRQDP